MVFHQGTAWLRYVVADAPVPWAELWELALRIEFRQQALPDRSREGLLDYDPVACVRQLDAQWGEHSGGAAYG